MYSKSSSLDIIERHSRSVEKVQKFIKQNDERLTENREILTINELKGSNLIRYNKMQGRPSIRTAFDTIFDAREYIGVFAGYRCKDKCDE